MIQKKNGFYNCKFKVDHPLAKKYYSGSKFKDNPETVLKILDDIPELRAHIDYDYYKAWVAALKRSESLKRCKDFNFSYDFKATPFQHQRLAIAFMLSLPCSALFAEPGTGKTLAASVLMDMRIKKGTVKKALVICPLSIMKTGWLADIEQFTHYIKPIIVHSVKGNIKVPNEDWKNYKTIADKIHAPNYNVFISTPDTVSNHIDDFINGGFDQVIIDESTMIASDSNRTKNVGKLRDHIKYRVVMSGTPGDLEQLYRQLNFVDMPLPGTMGEFHAKYYYQNPKYHYLKKPLAGAEEKVAKIIKDRCLYIRRSECLDLPPRMTQVREITPSKKVLKHYREVYKDLYTIIQDEELTPQNKLESIIKLHQILNGHTKIDGELKIIDENPPKVKEVKSIVEETPGKIIIWAHFREDFANLERALAEYNPAVINGSTNDSEAQEDKFKTDPSCKVMIAHSKSCRFGHNWTTANTTIFYTYTYSSIDFNQSRDRNYRIGQGDSVLEIILTGGGIEDKIVEAIQTKTDFAQDILDNIESLKL